MSTSAQSQAPDSEEVARNPWGQILRYPEWRTLELRWLPTAMTDAAFKETLELLARMGEQYPTQFMIIDATEFRHEFGEGLMQWREANIIPRYNSAGVTKFAFVVAEGFPGTVESGGEPSIESSAHFPTAWFTTRDRAYRWLAGD